jgi:glucose-1-phosphate adenylyltransferase
MGVAIDSIVSPGCIVSGGRVVRSVLSPGVRVNSYCEVDSCILMGGVEVGRYSRLRNAIVDANVRIPDNSVIGFDPDDDSAAGYTVTESGVVVVAGAPAASGQSPAG